MLKKSEKFNIKAIWQARFRQKRMARRLLSLANDLVQYTGIDGKLQEGD